MKGQYWPGASTSISSTIVDLRSLNESWRLMVKDIRMLSILGYFGPFYKVPTSLATATYSFYVRWIPRLSFSDSLITVHPAPALVIVRPACAFCQLVLLHSAESNLLSLYSFWFTSIMYYSIPSLQLPPLRYQQTNMQRKSYLTIERLIPPWLRSFSLAAGRKCGMKVHDETRFKTKLYVVGYKWMVCVYIKLSCWRNRDDDCSWIQSVCRVVWWYRKRCVRRKCPVGGCMSMCEEK